MELVGVFYLKVWESKLNHIMYRPAPELPQAFCVHNDLPHLALDIEQKAKSWQKS